MNNELAALSRELASAVARAGHWVVAVNARPRFGSSGVLWRPGVIVTAEHTVRREDDITVVLPDGRSRGASLAGSDPGTDIAVLKIDEESAAPAPLSQAELQPGSLVLAIGRSPDSGVNATLGILSAVSGSWRTWRGGRLDRYIRLDLTVYPGSSGGAVIDTAGQILGIATTALSRIAGLAIPVSTVDRVVDELLSRGHVSRGYLGVGLQPVELPDRRKGLIVVSLEPDGPAAQAGLLIGDILLSLAGTPVNDTDDIQTVLESHPAGQVVRAGVLRGGAPVEVPVSVGERKRRR